MHGQVPHLGLAGEILNRAAVQKGKLETASAHAGAEDEEQRGKNQCQDPVDVEEPPGLTGPPLGEKIAHKDQRVETEQGRPKGELDEEFETRLGHYTADPRTEMVHLEDATAEFAAVVRPVGLVVVARRAKRRAAVPSADEDVLVPEVLGRVARVTLVSEPSRCVAFFSVRVDRFLFVTSLALPVRPFSLDKVLRSAWDETSVESDCLYQPGETYQGD